MNSHSEEKSISTIGTAILVQTAIKWGAIAFIGWLIVSNVGDWLSILTT